MYSGPFGRRVLGGLQVSEGGGGNFRGFTTKIVTLMVAISKLAVSPIQDRTTTTRCRVCPGPRIVRCARNSCIVGGRIGMMCRSKVSRTAGSQLTRTLTLGSKMAIAASRSVRRNGAGVLIKVSNSKRITSACTGRRIGVRSTSLCRGLSTCMLSDGSSIVAMMNTSASTDCCKLAALCRVLGRVSDGAVQGFRVRS